MATIYKNLNGMRIAMTEAEVAEHAEAQRLAQISSNAMREAKAAATAKKASGKQKLKNLGLDDEEIKELTGA
jgi:hypothetical protein